MRTRERLGARTDDRTRPAHEVIARDDYRVIRTPTCHRFHFGNYLSLDAPPRAEDLEGWFARCRSELAELTGVERLVLEWETGLDHVDEVVLEAPNVVLARPVIEHVPAIAPEGIELRSIASDDGAGWAAVLALAVADAIDRTPAHADFLAWRVGAQRDAYQRAPGTGGFWGAFDAATGELHGSLGLHESDDLLRFQDVETAAAQRRRGIASALCAVALRAAAARRPRALAVIVAEQGSQADRIYRRLGFAPVSLQWSVTRPL
jgi:ribosomal protein S18 acetylase RimI-like enzyme